MQFTTLIVENIVIGGMGSIWIGILLYRFTPGIFSFIQNQLISQDNFNQIILALAIPLIYIPLIYIFGCFLNDLSSSKMIGIFKFYDKRIRKEVIGKKKNQKTIRIRRFSRLDEMEKCGEQNHFMRFYIYHNSINIKKHLDYHRGIIRIHRSSSLNWFLIFISTFPIYLSPFSNNLFFLFFTPSIVFVFALISFFLWKQQSIRFYEMIIRSYVSLRNSK